MISYCTSIGLHMHPFVRIQFPGCLWQGVSQLSKPLTYFQYDGPVTEIVVMSSLEMNDLPRSHGAKCIFFSWSEMWFEIVSVSFNCLHANELKLNSCDTRDCSVIIKTLHRYTYFAEFGPLVGQSSDLMVSRFDQHFFHPGHCAQEVVKLSLQCRWRILEACASLFHNIIAPLVPLSFPTQEI